MVNQCMKVSDAIKARMEKDKTINFKINWMLYRDMKIKLANENKTIKEYMTKLIEDDLGKK